jgi:hypothetical protein
MVNELRTKLSDYSGMNLKSELVSLRHRLKYLFNSEDVGNDVFKSLVMNQKFWEKKEISGREGKGH